MRRYFILLACCLCTATVVRAQEPLTLDAAVRAAADRAPGIEARRATVEAATAQSRRAGSLPEPMLMLGVENLPATGADAFDPSVDDMTMKRIGLRREMPAGAKREAERTVAARRVDEAEAMLDASQRDVRQATAEAWIEAWAAAREIAALRALREQAQVAADLARARGAAGGDLSDALAAQAGVLDIDSRLEAAQGRRNAAMAQLRRWVPEARADALAGEPDFSVLPVTREQLAARLDDIASLRVAGAAVESAAASIDLARAQARPDWSVALSYGQRGRDRSDMLSVEVGVALPWFTRSRQALGIQASEAEYRAALSLREDRRRELAAAVDAAWTRWESQQRQVALHLSRLLPLARDRSRVALAAYRAGGPLQAWLDARRAELELHRDHAEHEAELGKAWAALAYLLTETTP